MEYIKAYMPNFPWINISVSRDHSYLLRFDTIFGNLEIAPALRDVTFGFAPRGEDTGRNMFTRCDFLRFSPNRGSRFHLPRARLVHTGRRGKIFEASFFGAGCCSVHTQGRHFYKKGWKGLKNISIKSDFNASLFEHPIFGGHNNYFAYSIFSLLLLFLFILAHHCCV